MPIQHVKGRNEKQLYSEIIQTILDDDTTKAKELLFYFSPAELDLLSSAGDALSDLIIEVQDNYPNGDI